jgi:guanosine-3',5'-bis(diphosphate) 3'-pyrophosphohydrolase
MNGVVLVSRAADFAAQRHAGILRKGAKKEPYVNHLAEVAKLLAEVTEGEDAVLVAAGWLHDTVEDTATSREELEQEFGSDVATVVAECTDDKSLLKAERKRLQIVHAAEKSPRARMLKIADKTSNVRSLVVSPPDSWERDRLVDYVDWAEKVVAQCRGLNPELEKAFDTAVAEARRVI